MEKGAGYARGDGYEIALVGKDFDLARTGEVGEIDCASGADARGREFVCGDAGHLGEEFPRVNEEFK